MNRLDALVGRKYTDNSGAEKTAWTRIGVAFPSKTGGWVVQLDAIPAPQDGSFRFILKEPRPYEGKKTPAPNDAPLDDEIPF